MKASKTLAKIDATLEAEQPQDHRNHLGASIIGYKCLRQVWYIFHWSAKERFIGQMLRLFERGDLEEDRFTRYLEKIGCEVWPVDPATGRQWRVTFAQGHGGGSSDGVGRGLPDLAPDEPFLIECKTHNEKSFKALENDGLCQSKPEHFAQSQIYMVLLELPAALYMAVNKNTDHLYLEILRPNPGFVASLTDRAEQIVFNETPPDKISNTPSFYLCRFCHFSSICHEKVSPEINCRTCHFAQPEPGGVWRCGKYDYPLSRPGQQSGCDSYLLNSAFTE